MKTMIYHEYGSPEVLDLIEMNRPIPRENEVLLKVCAVALNASDYEYLTGSPAYIRMWGLLKPKNKILGSDISGVVEAVGAQVTQFKVGDAVFGDLFDHWGGFAEYVCAPVSRLSFKPNYISFQEAAAIPQAGLVALQGLRYSEPIQKGQKILINGAGGGAGTFAIQLAKLYGAEVTGVDNIRKQRLMKDIGADHVLDYKRSNYTYGAVQYDYILDFVGAHSIAQNRKVLNSKGTYVMVGGSIKRILQAALLGPLISLGSQQKIGLLVHQQNKEDIQYLLTLFKNGKVKPIIDRTYHLKDAKAGLRYLGAGQARGKVLLDNLF